MNDDLIERYVEAATAGMGEPKGDDTRDELRTHLRDTVAEKVESGKDYEDADFETLKELGDPAVLAANYAGRKTSLISGEYYRVYLKVLKVVMPLAFVLYMILAVLTLLYGKDKGIFAHLDFVNGPITLLASAFGVITFVFALMERYRADISAFAWSPERLKGEISSGLRISRVQTVVSFFIALIFTLIAVKLPDLLSELGNKVPGFFVSMSEGWRTITPFLLAVFAVITAVLIVRMIVPVWNILTVAVTVFANIAVLIFLALILFGQFPNCLLIDGKPLSGAGLFTIRAVTFFVLVILFIVDAVIKLKKVRKKAD
jgi:hypothetical protein